MGRLNKLIPKYQNPSGPLIQQIDPTFATNYYNAIQQEFKEYYPEIYNKLQYDVALSDNPSNEIVTWVDANGNTRKSGRVVGLSAADPIAAAYVSDVVLGKPVQWAAKKVFKTIANGVANGVDQAKNLINRYTSPKTNIKHSPFLGNNLELVKQRLANGGFDKLGIGSNDVIIIPKDHPLAPLGTLKRHKVKKGNITKFSYGDDAEYVEINARQFLEQLDALLKSDVVDENGFKQLDDKVLGKIFGASYRLDTKRMIPPVSGPAFTMNQVFNKSVDAHEFWHAVDDVLENLNKPYKPNYYKFMEQWLQPDKQKNAEIPGVDLSKIPQKIRDYFVNHKNTELRARLMQLKNYFGITDPNQPITVDQWNYARRHYVNDMGFDNNMQQMFRAVTDPQKFLDWINPKVASFTGLGLVGVQGINNQTQHKTGGKLIPKHAKGSPVNTNPLPERPINTNPIPKKEDKKKKKLFEIDQRVVGLRPTPGLLTFPKGTGNGLYMIKRNE